MISAMVNGETLVKFGGMTFPLSVTIVYKFQFKDNKIRISGNWVDANLNGNQHDIGHLLNNTGVRCFNGKGEINNKTRYVQYSELSNNLLTPLITFSEVESDDW